MSRITWERRLVRRSFGEVGRPDGEPQFRCTAEGGSEEKRLLTVGQASCLSPSFLSMTINDLCNLALDGRPILINELLAVEFCKVLLNMKHLQHLKTGEISVLINEPAVVE
jgi:hypothetical protein